MTTTHDKHFDLAAADSLEAMRALGVFDTGDHNVEDMGSYFGELHYLVSQTFDAWQGGTPQLGRTFGDVLLHLLGGMKLLGVDADAALAEAVRGMNAAAEGEGEGEGGGDSEDDLDWDDEEVAPPEESK